jgi:peptidoglycan/xylan/chitin deacetylase (PgdA/CDA1 family)
MILAPVLLYHSVNDRPGRLERAFAVPPSTFSAHVEAIAASGRSALTVTELADGLRQRRLPARPLAITFDDGYADNLGPIEMLLARGLGATVYVTTGEVGARNRLTPSQLAELASIPAVEIGAHSVSHPRLDELGDAELAEEIRASKLRLEDMTGRGVWSFAYPYGAYDSRVRRAVIGAGYVSAAAVKDALSHDRDDPFAIARWTVTGRASAARVAAVLEGEGVPCAWSHERLRTRAFRAARRSRRRLAHLVRT